MVPGRNLTDRTKGGEIFMIFISFRLQQLNSAIVGVRKTRGGRRLGTA